MTIYDPKSGTPVLFVGDDQKIGLSQAGHDGLAKTRDTTQRAIESRGADAYDKHLLLGESVVIHCKRLGVDPSEEGRVTLGIGASTLDEALKESIGAFDFYHLDPPGESSDYLYPPDWVASTHKELGQLLADYYSCELRPISEVV